MSTQILTCPKCGSDMRTYERNRVVVDQCTGCGGLFLDRGELESLVTAETAWHQSAAPARPPRQEPPAPTAYGQPPAQQYPSAPRYATSPGYGYGQPGHRRRRSFLSELFDD